MIAFARLPESLRTLSPVKAAFAALGLGGLSMLAFPPVFFVPILLVTFPALVFLIQGARSPRTAFGLGWCFAFGQLVPNLYWIAGALMVDVGSFGWALPGALFGLPSFFALDYAIAAAIAKRWLPLDQARGIIGFALLWFLGDIARGHLFTGFPWDLTGYVWSFALSVMQSISVIGIYGLSLITVVIAFLPALLACPAPEDKRKGRIALAASAVLLIAIAGAGALRLHNAPMTTTENVRVRLVQPSLNQADKWRPEEREKNFDDLLALTFTALPDDITHIIWPETATAFYLGEDIPHRLAITSLLSPTTKLITGVVQRYPQIDRTDYFNSLIVLDDTGHIVAGYDKSHLVPFGEYIPFRDAIPVKALTALGVNFKAGEGLQTLRPSHTPPFSPQICYEAIFPGDVAASHDWPEWIVNVTNDAWYDGTIGPAQHFAIVRARAIEEGLPLARAANKGTVAMIDAYGRVTAQLGPDKPGVVDAALPRPTPTRTIFSLYGESATFILFFTVLFAFLLPHSRQKNARNPSNSSNPKS